MYDFSKKLKLWAIGFMVVGAVGIIVGFMSAPIFGRRGKRDISS